MTELIDVMRAIVRTEKAIEGIAAVYLTQPWGLEEPEFPCIWNFQRLLSGAYGTNAMRRRKYTIAPHIILGPLTAYDEELAEIGIRIEQSFFDVFQRDVLLGGLSDVSLSELRSREDNPQGIGPDVAGASKWVGHVLEFDLTINDVGVAGP